MPAHTQHSLPTYRTTVRDEWIDYNGHLSEAYYVLIFGFATDRIMDSLGMDAAYRERTGCSLYTVEAHIRYLFEVTGNAEVTVTARMIAAGEKKLHLAYEMHSAGQLVATEEILALHVGGDQPSAVPFPVEVAQRIAQVHHTEEPVPDWVGRAIR